jgi:hypothetical protein
VKRELIYKMRTDILNEMNGEFEFTRLNQKLDDLKTALEDEYLALKMELFERSQHYREALQFIRERFQIRIGIGPALVRLMVQRFLKFQGSRAS